MKRLIWATKLIILFLVFVLPGVAALAIHIIPDNDQPGYGTDEKVSVYGKRTVSQVFLAQEKNLTAIGISLGNPNLRNKKEIILALYDGENLIRTSVLNGQNLEDGDFVKFVFSPVPDSKGKEYRFTISSPEAGPEEVIYAFFTKSVPTWMIGLKYDDAGKVQDVEGELPFVTYHLPGGRLEVFKVIYSRFLPQSSQKF